tara:strand:- start:309 stop:1055 length:747 start_codon:yes stop_codon:yes gene_type:complete
MAASGVAGYSNTYSFAFDGSNDFFTAGNPSNLNFEKDEDFSVSFWIKRPLGSSTKIIGGRADASSPFSGYIIFINSSNKLFWRLRGPNARHIGLKTSGTVPDNVWTNYVLIFNGTGGGLPNNTFFNIYENGVDISTVSLDTGNPTDISGVSIPFNVGTRDDTATSTFEGNIDEFAVYDYVLTAANAVTIYNSGVPNDISSFNPVSWWRMGENATWDGSQWTMVDQGSGGNDATSNNMAEADREEEVPN